MLETSFAHSNDLKMQYAVSVQHQLRLTVFFIGQGNNYHFILLKQVTHNLGTLNYK